MSEKKPSDSLQHIQFEGCDVCVIAPEDYDALIAALETSRAEFATLKARLPEPYKSNTAKCCAMIEAAIKSSRGDL